MTGARLLEGHGTQPSSALPIMWHWHERSWQG